MSGKYVLCILRPILKFGECIEGSIDFTVNSKICFLFDTIFDFQ